MALCQYIYYLRRLKNLILIDVDRLSVFYCLRLLSVLMALVVAQPSGLMASPHQKGDYTVFRKNDKKGLRDSRNRVLIPAEYDDLGWSNGGIIPLDGVIGYKENGLWGLINLKNQKIISPHYTQLKPLNGEWVIIAKYDHTSRGEKFGVINLKGNSILNPTYQYLESFNQHLIAAVLDEGRVWYGLLDMDFQNVIPYKYEKIEPLNGQYAAISLAGKVGIANHSGSIIVPPSYQEIKLQGNKLVGKPLSSFELRTSENKFVASHKFPRLQPLGKDLYLGCSPQANYLTNLLGTKTKPYPGCEILGFADGVASIRRGNQYGVIDKSGNLVLPIEHDTVWISEGFIGVALSRERWVMLDRNLVRVTQREYQQVSPGRLGLYPIKRHGSWGFINGRGTEVIPPQYEQVRLFNQELAQARYGGSWGIINRQGNWLIKPRYDSLYQINQSLFLFKENRESGLVNTENRELYRTSNQLMAFHTALIETDKVRGKGLIALDGSQLLSNRYPVLKMQADNHDYFYYEDSIGPGLFGVSKKVFIKDPSFQEIRTINEGFIGVRINNQYGFIDENSKLRIANRYQNIGVFSETMSPIKIRGKWGYIDRLERLKIQPLYDWAGPFEKSTAIVTKGNKYGVVNLRGKIVVPLEYDSLVRMPENRFMSIKGGRKGLIEYDGRTLLHAKYDDFKDLGNGFIIVTRNNKYSLVSEEGVSMIPMIYNQITFDPINDLYLVRKDHSWEPIKL